ncbi:MAG: hypothetical protein KAW56_09150 [Candidatus Marinimicrobia bacterium]|nr:hypothetical protein [Candidatus Neomarinimicrobiota bacterium]
MPKSKIDSVKSEIFDDLVDLGKSLHKGPFYANEKGETGVNKLWTIETKFSNSGNNLINGLLDSVSELKLELTEKRPVKKDKFEYFLTKIGEYINEALGNYEYFGDISDIKEKDFHQNLSAAIDHIVEFKNRKRPSIINRKVSFHSKDENLYLALSKQDEKFIVSDGFLFDAFPFVDFWFDDKKDIEWMVNTYADKINKTFKPNDYDFICFAIKRYGGEGPVYLREEMKERLKKEIFFFNQPTRCKAKRYNLKPGELDGKKAIVLYDIALTLSGLVEAKTTIEEEQGGKFVGGIVFHNYDRLNKFNINLITEVESKKTKLASITSEKKFRGISWEKIINGCSENYPYLTNRSKQLARDFGFIWGAITSFSNPMLSGETAKEAEKIVRERNLVFHVLHPNK